MSWKHWKHGARSSLLRRSFPSIAAAHEVWITGTTARPPFFKASESALERGGPSMRVIAPGGSSLSRPAPVEQARKGKVARWIDEESRPKAGWREGWGLRSGCG